MSNNSHIKLKTGRITIDNLDRTIANRFDELNCNFNEKINKLEQKIDEKIDKLDQKLDGFISKTDENFKLVNERISSDRLFYAPLKDHLLLKNRVRKIEKKSEII